MSDEEIFHKFWQGPIGFVGKPTSDYREFAEGALRLRDLPMPFYLQNVTAHEGHEGGMICGRIMDVEFRDDGAVYAWGEFDDTEVGREASRLVRTKTLRGVSVDVAAQDYSQVTEVDADGIETPRTIIHAGELMGAHLLGFPAFGEAIIETLEECPCTDALVASNGLTLVPPYTPPKAWFANPKLTGPTPLTSTEEGRLFGHIALWNSCHRGSSFKCIKPPRSASNYAQLRLNKQVLTDEGLIGVGTITLATMHSDVYATADKALKMYEDTGTVFADFVPYEDECGIAIAGAWRPDAWSEKNLREFRASEPSGDWRWVNNNLELCHVLMVNNPGFPVQRTQNDEVIGLVASTGMVGKTAWADDDSSMMELLVREVTTLRESIAPMVSELKLAKLDAKVRDIRSRS